MPARNKFHFLNFTNGIYNDSSPLIIPENALYNASNIDTTYEPGSTRKRPGYENIGSALQASKSILGLHNFRQSASTQKMLATVDDATSDDTQLFYSTGGSWTEISAAETAWANKAGMNVEMEDFIGYCFFVGYGATDGFLPVGSLTGTTFSTSTNVTSMPSAKFIKRYRDRLYIFNCDIGGTAYPYRCYFSSVPSAGSITWTVASDFIDVDFSEAGTGLATNWDRLVLFTEYGAYMYNQDEKKAVWDVGCSNHRTIRNHGQYMIWANRDGVYVSTGGKPQNVSGRMKKFILASNITTAFAEVVDEEYYLYLGSVTVNDVTFTNCAIVWNIATNTWRVEEYADTIKTFGKYYSSGQDYLYMGDSTGDVHRRGKYTDATLLTSDDGNDIDSWFQTGALHLGDPSTVKRLGKIIAYSNRAQGLMLKSRVFDTNTQAVSKFVKLIQLKDFISEMQINPRKGHFLQIEGIERSSLPYWNLYGFTVTIDIDKPLKN